MFRPVSIFVLIAAITACPFSCKLGVCSTPHQTQNKVESRCPNCCQNDSNKHQCPSDNPCDGACQGICGGAVFQSTIESPLAVDLPAANLVALDTPNAASQANQDALAGEFHQLCSDPTGRIMRTLHMSFLL